jgi:heat-inducible transcriptional repressor
MAECSVIAAPYGAGEKMLGCIGVVGPVRMDYARVVPLVELSAQMISDVLTSSKPGKLG